MYYSINAKQKANDEVVDGGMMDSDVFFEIEHAKRMQLEDESSSTSFSSSSSSSSSSEDEMVAGVKHHRDENVAMHIIDGNLDIDMVSINNRINDIISFIGPVSKREIEHKKYVDESQWLTGC